MLKLQRKSTYWLIGIGIPLFLLCLIFLGTRTTFSYKSNTLSESNQPIQNPYCGFFHLYGYTLSEDTMEKVQSWCQQMLENDTNSLVLLQINLRQYSNETISAHALQQLDYIFSSFSERNKQLIVRFLYDWDGKALETEPISIQQLFAHMEQVAPVVNKHKNHIFSLQGVFTGNCGEMNQTNYGTDQHIRLLMNKLANVITPEIFLSVRTPSHLRTITNQKPPLNAAESYQGTLISRLGLYNDGMMGNVFDCGTYDDTSYATAKAPGEKGTREEELAFQNQLCNFVPNGGEVIIDNPYNDFERARNDLATMHISYLSCDYDANVLNKWKRAIYHGDDTDVFQNCNGYEYIQAHLGYRYVVTNSQLTKDILSIFLINTGFAPAYRPFSTILRIQNSMTQERIGVPIQWDTRTLLPEKNATEISVKLPKLEKGDYLLSLEMTDPATKLPIRFANTEATDAILPLGTVTVH